VALVQFSGDRERASECHRIVRLDRQWDSLQWKRYEVSRGSPKTSVNLRPISEKNVMPVVLMGPRVSKASGWKVWERRVFCLISSRSILRCTAWTYHYYVLYYYYYDRHHFSKAPNSGHFKAADPAWQLLLLSYTVFGDVRHRHTDAVGELSGCRSRGLAASWSAGLWDLQWRWPARVREDLQLCWLYLAVPLGNVRLVFGSC